MLYSKKKIKIEAWGCSKMSLSIRCFKNLRLDVFNVVPEVSRIGFFATTEWCTLCSRHMLFLSLFVSVA